MGTYCNGTQWVTGHDWTGYDGMEYYATHGGDEAVCRDPAGAPVANGWDRGWRRSYSCCVAVARTREIAADLVERMGELGVGWVQFLDQNCGAASFGCYSADHGHPPAPGRWMTTAMSDLLNDLDRIGSRHDGMAFSVESAIADNLLGRFASADLRPDYASGDIPLYTYLFHQYVITHATFAPAPPPHTALLRTAQAFVMGDQPGVTLGPNGRVLDGTADVWPSWDTPLGNQTAVRLLLRRTIALRRGPGKPFLLFGRLRRDSGVSDIAEITWAHHDRLYHRPAVLTAAWTSPAGHHATALANWTDTHQPATITTPSTKPATLHIQADDACTITLEPVPRTRLQLPPLSAGLLIEPATEQQ